MLLGHQEEWFLCPNVFAKFYAHPVTTPTQIHGSAFYVTAPAHLHATSVAVHTTLFSFKHYPPELEVS